MDLEQYQKCPKCGETLKHIPIKKLGDEIIIELYCENCDESITLYPNTNTISFKQPHLF